MKVKQSSLRILKPLSSLNEFFLVIPPRRFIVFGEGKRGKYRGIAVEGYLNETFQKPAVYSFEDALNGAYVETNPGYDPLQKIDDFEDLVGAPVITRFELSRHAIKLLRNKDARHYTHVRFYKKPNGKTMARVFDARKYFSSSIIEKRVDDYEEIEMRTDAHHDFVFYIELALLKVLPLDDYEVTVLEDELVTFDGLESGLSFHMRDQRLGQQMEERILDIGSYDDLLFIDIERMKPSSADWKNPDAKPRKERA